MKHHRLHILLFACILALACVVRVYGLGTNPAGFFCDEAAIGFNAFTLLVNGTDEYGTAYPTFFRSFGEYKSPVAIYATVPFIKFLGLSEFSVRLQSVFFGLISIVMIYLLTKSLFTKNIALIAAAIAATMPWLVHYNRTGFEMNSYIAFFTATIYLLLKAVKDKRFIIPAALVAALTLYTYYSAKLMTPLFLFGFLLIYRKKFLPYKKELCIAAGIFLLLSIPFFISFLNGEGTARFNEVSVFTANLPVAGIALRVLENYFLQFSPTLFLGGEPTFITRHFTNGLTPLLFITIPFWYIGIASLLSSIKKPVSKVLLLWLFLYPIGAAVSAEAPFTGRTIIGAPLSAIVIALGITTVVTLAKQPLTRRVLLSGIAGAVVINFLFFVQFYFLRYPMQSADYWGWQYGPKEIVGYFEAKKDQYDELYMIGEFNAPHIFFYFYAPYGCEKCDLGVPHERYNPDKKQLFAVSPYYIKDNPKIKFEVQKTIYYPDGKAAFIIGEVQ